MDSNRKYAFNLPWRGVLVFAGFYVGLAVFMGHLAKDFTGAIFLFLVALSVIFVVLAFIMLTRRLLFPRVLELSEDAILFPRGFPKTRIVRIPYADIILVSECSIGGRSSFCMVTGTGSFEIGVSYFPNIESFLAVRGFICSKALIAMPPHDERGVSAWRTWREFPEPFLRWKEPDDWARYRTGLFSSKPLFSRIGRAFWFFVRCFGIIILPWLVLLVCGLPTSPAVEYLWLAFAATSFFTCLHWLYAAHPAHATEISLREKGISQFFGKQTMHHNYHQFSGWVVVERRFEERVLLILLLQSRHGVRALALPGPNIRDQLVQIFQDKQIPQVRDLRPPWE